MSITGGRPKEHLPLAVVVVVDGGAGVDVPLLGHGLVVAAVTVSPHGMV